MDVNQKRIQNIPLGKWCLKCEFAANRGKEIYFENVDTPYIKCSTTRHRTKTRQADLFVTKDPDNPTGFIGRGHVIFTLKTDFYNKSM